ncbi:uncharacterized protein BJX67DRAFT_380162 [Aspergillus lucknowensis]|uniref:Calcofluor white hypersensitive protein n=1 Tax=Aspergillus lucknowensis TaxID=176173 RepID=A0ABR4LUY1_9EURO
MAAPAKSRTGLYLGIGAVGVGAYYLYRAGGSPQAAKDEMKYDANKARAKAPGAEKAERAGETAGLETNLNIEEAANNPRTRNSDLTAQAQRKLDEVGQAGKDQASKVRSEVEEKASEAKSTVSGWFGGKK